MPRIVVLGSGVMGTSIAVPVSENGHEVLLVGSPLDDNIIASLESTERCHPKIGVAMTPTVSTVTNNALCADHFKADDIILIGVSSAGIPWALERICTLATDPSLVMMITKGLNTDSSGIVRTLPPLIEENLAAAGFSDVPVVGVGGPCIAKELAEGQPTAGIFASRDPQPAITAKGLFERPYYKITLSDDFLGVEACAALKNLMTIAISYTWTKYPAKNPTATKPHDMNPAAAWFQQAVDEMAVLSELLGGRASTAYGLAGLGDLFVTVNAGRNSRMGQALGQGMTVAQAFAGPLQDETVEGVDTGRELAGSIAPALAEGDLDGARIPLTLELIKTLSNDDELQFDINNFYC